MSINYKYNGGRGAVLCRQCRVILDSDLSKAEAIEAWEGRDICRDCIKKIDAKGKKQYERR